MGGDEDGVALAASADSAWLSLLQCGDAAAAAGLRCLTVGVDSASVDVSVLGELCPALQSLRLLPAVSHVSSLRDLGRGFGCLLRLSAVRCGLTDLEGVDALPSLTELDVSGNPIADLSPLQSALRLTRLSCRQSAVLRCQQLDWLQELPALRQLDVGLQPTGRVRLAVIAALPQLQTLDGQQVELGERAAARGQEAALSLSPAEAEDAVCLSFSHLWPEEAAPDVLRLEQDGAGDDGSALSSPAEEEKQGQRRPEPASPQPQPPLSNQPPTVAASIAELERPSAAAVRATSAALRPATAAAAPPSFACPPPAAAAAPSLTACASRSRPSTSSGCGSRPCTAGLQLELDCEGGSALTRTSAGRWCGSFVTASRHARRTRLPQPQPAPAAKTSSPSLSRSVSLSSSLLRGSSSRFPDSQSEFDSRSLSPSSLSKQLPLHVASPRCSVSAVSLLSHSPHWLSR